MFNISGEMSQEKNKFFNLKNLKAISKEVFRFQNIIIYILAFLVSGVSIKGQVVPFGLAILAACLGTTVPVFVVFIVSIISSLIFQGAAGFEFYFLTSIFYFISVVLLKPRISVEERNEIIKTGGKLFWATFIVTQINNIFNIFLIYDFLMGIVVSAITYVFYKIFVNGIVVIRDFNVKKAFSIEELVAMAIIVAIASIPFNTITFFGLTISNIVLIAVLMILGWKNGVLLGGTAGICVGLALSILGTLTPIQIASIAVSGAIAGLLNKFGKIGVIIGFILGNAILTYVTNGNTVTIIYFREIFIASIILLFVPNNIKLKVEDLFGKDKLLTNIGETRLNSGEEILNKINAISTSLTDLTNKIQDDEDIALSTIENLVEDFLDNLEDQQDNMFYEDLRDNEQIVKEMFEQIQIKDILVEKDIVEIFKKHNNFILLKDETIRNDLQEIIKIINRTYKIGQIRNIKIEEKNKANKKVEQELNSVKDIITKAVRENNNTEISKKELEIYTVLKNKNYLIQKVELKKIINGKNIVNLVFDSKDKYVCQKDRITNIADLISKILGVKLSFEADIVKSEKGEYIQRYSNPDQFDFKIGSTKISKENSEASGDCNLQMKLNDGKYLLAISDGRGSGRNARNTSRTLIKMLKNLLSAGFDKEESLNLINSSLFLNKDEEMFTTMDISILDLYEGNMTSIKNAACCTYIKNKNSVKKIETNALPVGIMEEVEKNSIEIKLNDGDIIVMCSDGLLESKNEINKDWVEEFLKNVNTNNVQKLSDLIVAEAVDNSYGIVKDDITVIVGKVIKKK